MVAQRAEVLLVIIYRSDINFEVVKGSSLTAYAETGAVTWTESCWLCVVGLIGFTREQCGRLAS